MVRVIAYKDIFTKTITVMTTTYQLFSNTAGATTPSVNSTSANMGNSSDKENLKPSLIDEFITRYISNVFTTITILLTITLNRAYGVSIIPKMAFTKRHIIPKVNTRFFMCQLINWGDSG